MESNFDTVPTSAIDFVESEHGRLRRRQRGIDKKDLQRAMKYGMRKIQGRRTQEGHSISKYTYNDIVYVVDDITHQEITSYATPMSIDLVPVTEEEKIEHQRFKENLEENIESWTSHLVIVVDTSGIMRAADVCGARSRLAAVFLTIAGDIIAPRIESGAAGGTDVVSIITFGCNFNVITLKQPTTWVLYNQIATIYNQGLVRAKGHGYYQNGVQYARELLESNPCGSCAASLLFLSDRKPSPKLYDNRMTTEHLILHEIRSLAKTFGRRLTFQAVGIGDYDEFFTLQKMVDTAQDYGVTADLCVPFMSTSGLGDAFTSAASKLTTSQMELTNVITMKQEKVRNIPRESKTEASKSINNVSTEKFFIYPSRQVERFIYNETKVENPDVSGREKMDMEENV